jgi:hypothetical protein
MTQPGRHAHSTIRVRVSVFSSKQGEVEMTYLETLQDEAKQRRERLFNPPNAVDDTGIDLKAKRKRPMAIDLKLGPITPYLVKRTLPAPEDLTRVVCERYGVTPDGIQGKRRTQDLVRPRQAWAYLAHELLKLSYPQIGRYLGGRDHTTPLHAHRKITDLVNSDVVVSAEIHDLKARLSRLFSLRAAVCCFDPREI